MLLLNAKSISKSFGSRSLFKKLSISIFEKNRIGLIGKNGSGKSTFLKILAGIETPDEGEVSLRKGLKVGYLPQTCDFTNNHPLEIVLEAFSNEVSEEEKLVQAKKWLSKVGFTGEEKSANVLSGGWKKRLRLALEMVRSPDLLLLDEPTNHLDLEGILWLEKFLQREAPPYILVSHDRYFLQHATNRMIEIDFAYPEGLFSFDGPYLQFLEKKEEFLEGQLQHERSLASKARRESEWLKSNPKARTTKSRSRTKEAEELLEELSEVRKRNQKITAEIDFVASERDTRKLLVAKNISKQLGEKQLFRNLDFTLSPGTRIGLMGPNGCGKTTLLRILAGEIPIDQGTIKRADDLKIVYFDQHRNQLPDTITLREALSPTGEFVTFMGRPIHVNGWCKRFLFSPDALDRPLSTFSGGEKARISIAHLMLQPADLLLLDEPTNDLDIPTLETLESTLQDFPGAVVLISHDRCLIDHICNALLGLGDPESAALFADRAQWEAAQKKEKSSPKTKEEKKPSQPSKKLTYQEKKEFQAIEETIAKLEKEIRELNRCLENPEPSSSLNEICTAVGLAEARLQELYLRWEELYEKGQLST